jgi:hypothetical protein
VVQTASRINFVPIGFQINSNGNECASTHSTIGHLIVQNIGELLAFILVGNLFLFRRFFLHQRPLRTSAFHVNIIGFWLGIAKEICMEVVIVSVIYSKQGYQINMLKNFVLFAIRPRPAFLNGILGYYDGQYAHEALQDMVAQVLLSIFGGYLALFGALSANHTTDPTRPGYWKVYMAGGIMSSITTDFVWIWFSLICNALVLICCGQWKPIAFLTIPVFKLFGFIITSPLRQLGLIIRNLHLRMARRTNETRDSEMVLDFSTNSWLRFWYAVSILVSLILFIGGWMFWSGFIRLSGELYCPQEMSTVDTAVIGFSVVLYLGRYLLSWLSRSSTTMTDAAKNSFPMDGFTQM